MPLIHDDHQIGQRHCLVLAVRDMDEGDAELALQPLQLLAHAHPQERVEGGERLVEQQHPWLGDQRPRQRNPLLLSAGELRRQTQREFPHLDQFEKFASPSVALGLADAPHL